jgi:hypothetical protein
LDSLPKGNISVKQYGKLVTCWVKFTVDLTVDIHNFRGGIHDCSDKLFL